MKWLIVDSAQPCVAPFPGLATHGLLHTLSPERKLRAGVCGCVWGGGAIVMLNIKKTMKRP